MTTVERYHDISCGHRVVGHENKCKYLHGHNYRFHFTVTAKELDKLGRVLDFGVIKSKLCMWLEENYDHKMLIWEEDNMLEALLKIARTSVYLVKFNPTAENIAEDFCKNIAPKLLAGTGCELIKLTIEETRKCSATYSIS